MKYVALIILMLLPSFVGAETVRGTKQMELSAKGIHSLVIYCGAGLLELKGVEGRDTIHVAAEIEVENFKEEDLQKFIEKNVRLNLKKKQNTAFLQSDIDAHFIDNIDARINLVVSIPGKLNLDIIDGSGAIKVSDLTGDLRIDDDSGSIEIENITGNVSVYDSSGSIVIEDISGNVMVKDGSGFVGIDYIKGDVIIIDGSGDMVIRHIDGNVRVKDGSGGIDISDVSKGVSINESGTGELEIERVKGKITTRE